MVRACKIEAGDKFSIDEEAVKKLDIVEILSTGKFHNVTISKLTDGMYGLVFDKEIDDNVVKMLSVNVYKS